MRWYEYPTFAGFDLRCLEMEVSSGCGHTEERCTVASCLSCRAVASPHWVCTEAAVRSSQMLPELVAASLEVCSQPQWCARSLRRCVETIHHAWQRRTGFILHKLRGRAPGSSRPRGVHSGCVVRRVSVYRTECPALCIQQLPQNKIMYPLPRLFVYL